ncbi:MAG: hypothetical protein HOW73_02660 [Polyangiaceae bacterium]|nr:hypothetical protein [Polyangiaceae bacterium]
MKSVKVDTAMRQIRVDLDWAANLKVPDFCIILKSSRVVEARDVTTRMWNAMQGSIAPTRAETELLYNMIDQNAR